MKKLFTLAALIVAFVAGMSAQECDEPITTKVPLDLTGKHGHVIGQGTYRHGSVACIEAVPDEGYVFAGWSDGSMENPRVFIVKYSLQSSFEKAPEKTPEKINENGLEMYTNHLTLFVSGHNGENYEIYTVTGVKIYMGHDDEVQLPMSGMYLVRSTKGVTKVLVSE